MILDDLPLFTQPAPAVPPGYRRRDPKTSKDAAAAVKPITGNLRAQILDVLRGAPEGLTDGELERRAEFMHYGFSTVRKRRSELYKMGFLAPVGTRDGMTVWVRTET
jgi:hypothetical protein